MIGLDGHLIQQFVRCSATELHLHTINHIIIVIVIVIIMTLILMIMKSTSIGQ